jgi:hypothetical protein
MLAATGNCAACHAGGNNSVIPDHTLRKGAMEQYLTGGFTLEAITYQVSPPPPHTLPNPLALAKSGSCHAAGTQEPLIFSAI